MYARPLAPELSKGVSDLSFHQGRYMAIGLQIFELRGIQIAHVHVQLLTSNSAGNDCRDRWNA